MVKNDNEELKPVIIFRAEGSIHFGTGHIMRLRSFVDGLPKSVKPVLVTKKDKGCKDAVAPLIDNGWDVYFLSQDICDKEDASRTAFWARRKRARAVITDLCHNDTIKNPERLVMYHRVLRQEGAPFVMSFEDIRLKRFSSNTAIIWNSFSDHSSFYEPLDNCRIFEGGDFFVAHPSITAAGRQPRHIRRDARKILVFISGSDPQRITVDIAKVFFRFLPDYYKVSFVVSPIMHGREEVITLCGKKENMEAVQFSDDFSKLLLQTDIAVLGEGLAKFDGVITGTPTVLVTSHNPDNIALKEFLSFGATEFFGPYRRISGKYIVNMVVHLLRDYKKRATLSQNGKQLTDGCGAERIYKKILHGII